MKTIIIIQLLLLGFINSGVSQDNQHEFQDLDTTLSWLNGIEADFDFGGWTGDYFFQYFIPEADGYINSIDFNFSDVPDFSGGGLSMRIFNTEYPSWSELNTGLLADLCLDGNLGYFDEESGFEITGTSWIQGGVNQTDGADTTYSYDPISTVWFPAFGTANMAIEPNEADSGIYSFPIITTTDYLFEGGVPLAIVVRLNGFEHSSASEEESRFGFASVQLDIDPSPCLKFYGTISRPDGRCGLADYGWYIRSYVWDWRVNVTYTTPLGVNQPHELPNRPEIVSVFPNPFNPSTTIEYELPEHSDVSLIIYDIAGREVQTLVSTSQPTGGYQTTWGGVDRDGHDVAAGVYIVTLSTQNWFESKKIVMLK